MGDGLQHEMETRERVVEMNKNTKENSRFNDWKQNVNDD